MSEEHKKTLIEVWAWIKPKSLSELLKMTAIVSGIFVFVFKMGGSYTSITDKWGPVPEHVRDIRNIVTQMNADIAIYRSDNTLLKDSLARWRQQKQPMKGDYLTDK